MRHTEWKGVSLLSDVIIVKMKNPNRKKVKVKVTQSKKSLYDSIHFKYVHVCVCVRACVCAMLILSVVSNSLRPHGCRLLRPQGFSRQEYSSGLPFPPPGDLSNLGIEPWSPTLRAHSLPSKPLGKPKNTGVGSQSLFSRESSQPRNQTGVSFIAGGFFTS